ncbi:MAG: putative metal-dependent hydrolase [Flavobacterium sp.]|nr:putative metal-dependent hydrolase [Flavobacterium sp.]
MILEKQKYPIGRFATTEYTEEVIIGCIAVLARFPSDLTEETSLLSNEQLDTPYRDYGWTIRQLINHCADSHMNCLIRFKLALTESNPTIKPYYEARWAELADSLMPISSALKIIEGVHERWVVLLESLQPLQFARTFVHPEHGQQTRLDETVAFYAWHCKHHLAHVVNLKIHNGWK